MKRIESEDYLWEDVTGLTRMLDWLNGKVRVDINLDIRNVSKAMKCDKHTVFGWGFRASYTDDAIEFSDGTILVCVSVSEFAGTFASHDNISVRYYALTPRVK